MSEFVFYPGDAGVVCSVCQKRPDRGSLRIDGTHTYVCRGCIEALSAALPAE